MTDSEKLNLILPDMQGMKTDMKDMKSDMQKMKSDMQKLKQRITSIELHLENTTDKNIQGTLSTALSL